MRQDFQPPGLNPHARRGQRNSLPRFQPQSAGRSQPHIARELQPRLTLGREHADDVKLVTTDRQHVIALLWRIRVSQARPGGASRHFEEHLPLVVS